MGKRILILCDGTWNDLEMRYITNVGRLAQILEPLGPDGDGMIPQVIYYDDGVAAADQGFERFWNGAFGGGLERNIYEAYRFLCFNYQPGDQLLLFGFSRGAYTIRSLAGMLARIGLAPRTEMKYIPEAMEAYRGSKAAQEAYRAKTGSRDIPVDFLGCWDTVGARGIPDKIPWLSLDEALRKKYEFHDTELGANIRFARHAVATDEQRAEFGVTLMQCNASPADLKQVWFPGDHGCVGGGSWEKRGMSNAALIWMLEEARACDFPLGIKPNRIPDFDLVDPSIFFDPEVKWPFSRKARSLKRAEVTCEHLHPSLVRRYQELPETRSGPLRKVFGDSMPDLDPPPRRQAESGDPPLDPGQSTWIRAWADPGRGVRFPIREGQSYNLTVSTAQVWKDGDLDPCDARGWNLLSPENPAARPPWKAGRPEDMNWLEERLVRGRSNRLMVPDANWFELVGSTQPDSFFRFSWDDPAPDTLYLTATLETEADGNLLLTANDLIESSPRKFEDRRGWLWVAFTRMS